MDTRRHPFDLAKFRVTAELRRQAQCGSAHKSDPETNAQFLLHELQVNQVELELQNEELQHTQDELASLADKYAELYDLAPVGYLSLDRFGVILQGNLTAAKMLGMVRSLKWTP